METSIETTCSPRSYSGTTLACVCIISATERRTDESALQASGALEIAASSVLVSTEFKDTLLTADNMQSIGELAEGIYSLSLYCGIWGVSLLGILAGCWSDQPKKTSFQIKDLAVAPLESASTAHVHLQTYILETFPVVFRDQDGWSRLWSEILQHHRYLYLLFSNNVDRSERVVTTVHLMTIQTMLLFMLVRQHIVDLFYGLRCV